MSRGIVLFGINNERIDYIKLAVIAAGFIKKNMPGTSICLITDSNSADNSQFKLTNYFTHVVLTPEGEQQFANKRTYRDTQYYYFEDSFKNETRSLVYNLTPFDETLLLDTDYLICNNVYSNVWGSYEDVMINKNAIDLLHAPLQNEEDRLNKFGIKMYWATAIYFKKSEKAEQLFDLVEHIKHHWAYYKLTYDFPGTLFRNDYAFSIAIHILNGFVDTDEYFPPLPDEAILSSLDSDQFFKIKSANEMVLFVNDKKETWKFYASKIKGLNVHCMNKISLLNNAEEIMKVLYE